MKTAIAILSLITPVFIGSCIPNEEPMPTRSKWNLAIKIDEPLDVYVGVKATDSSDFTIYNYVIDNSNGSKRPIYLSPIASFPNDTPTQSTIDANLDSIYAFIVSAQDTLYLDKSMTDLSNYYLQPVVTLDLGTQIFSFITDIDYNSFK